MLREKAVALLKVRPEEVRMVTLMAVLFLCVQAGQGIGENAAFALFLSRVDVDRLPYMYMGLGGVVFIASLAYSAGLTKFQNASVVVSLLVGAAILFLVEWLGIIFVGNSISYPILWLTTYSMSVILGTLLWTVAGEVCDARQAKRLFPLFTSMGILGSVFGNSITGFVAKLTGTESLIVIYAVLLTAGFLLTRKITQAFFKQESEVYVRFSLIDDIRAGYGLVQASQLFRLVAISSILYSLLYFTVDFPFSKIVSESFLNDSAGLAGFKGTFTSITTIVTFLVSLFLANRVYTRLGIVNSILIMPLTYVIGFIVFFISFRFEVAVGARLLQLVVLGGLMGTAWNALFNVAPPERRGQILAFNNGVPAQIGVVLSGVMILLSRQVLRTQDVLLLGAFFAFISVYLTMRMRSAYGDALLDALRAGRVEVFSDEDDAFSGYKEDPAAMQTILKALHDPRAYTRRLAAEMLAITGNILAVPDLVERLSDDDAGVRAAATQALADLGAKQAFSAIMLGLDDVDDMVRERSLASLPRLEVVSSPELIRTLEGLLKDPNIVISARAAVVLIHLGEGKGAQALLVKLLKSEDVNSRHVALIAIREIAKNTKDKFHFKIELILDVVNDPIPVIRRDAIPVAVLLGDDAVYEIIANHLADEDARVRKAASESLKQAWAKSRSAVLHILETMDEIALTAALDAIPPGDEEVLLPLRGYIQREVSNIRYYRSMIESVPQKGRATVLLVEALNHRESSCEERLMKAIGLFGNARALDLIRKSLKAGDASTRAAALEALETLGDKRITRDVLPILDRGGVFLKDKDEKMDIVRVVEILLAQDDPWVRALGTYVVHELKLTSFVPELRKLLYDPEPLVQDAARSSIARMDGTVIMKPIKNLKTLKTLSALDRILLLREVPIFSQLEPVDLEKIADIAEEQLFSNQSLLCSEGEAGNTMFIITSGKVDVIKKTGNRESVLATRASGEFAGEMAILESAPRSATLKAQGDVRVLIIDGDAFNTILLDRPEVAVSMLRHMSTRVRELNEKVSMAG